MPHSSVFTSGGVINWMAAPNTNVMGEEIGILEILFGVFIYPLLFQTYKIRFLKIGS